DRPRLGVFRSLKNISAQIINDDIGQTLVSVSSLEKEIKDKGHLKKQACAEQVGALLAQRALAKGLKQVVFDRGGYRYHGRVAALAEAARKAGLQF
ncbi:MAG: 50S ribosomal protein L18, partial [Candidatus Tectomicrobia bacterium]|nr:50S ribosomal protein L18 [Candidatus Tectomicrobia bacterium]